VIAHVYFVAGGRLWPTVDISGWVCALNVVRSLNMPRHANPTITPTTAKKKITFPIVERAGPDFLSGGG
jgi:hypothetical protein